MAAVWKKSISLLLAFVMVFGMMPVHAFADDVEDLPVETDAVTEEYSDDNGEDDEEMLDDSGDLGNPDDQVDPDDQEDFEGEDEIEEELTFGFFSPRAALSGDIWVNRGDLSNELTGILGTSGGFKKAILDAVLGEDSPEVGSVEYKKYTVSYDGMDVLYDGGIAPGVGFAQEKKDTLYNEVMNNSGVAVFAVSYDDNGDGKADSVQDASIDFRDSRKVVTFAVADGGNVGTYEDEVNPGFENLRPFVVDWVRANVTITADDPMTEEVEAEYVDVNSAVLVDPDDYSWPGNGEENVLTFLFGFEEDHLEYQEEYANLSMTLRDTTKVYQVKYVCDYNGETVTLLDETYHLEQGMSQKTPRLDEDAFAEYLTKKFYKQSWSPAIADYVTESVTYTAVWTPVVDNNQNGIADQVETYTVVFDKLHYEGVSKAIKSEVAYGTPMADVMAALEAAYQEIGLNLQAPTRKDFNFNGWKPSLPLTVKAPAEKDSVTVTFEAQWTEDQVVTFVGPTGEQVTAAVVLNGKVADDQIPAPNYWQGYCVTDWVTADNQSFDFANTAITGPVTLKATWVADRNGNGIEDGTTADPFTYYRWFQYYTDNEPLYVMDWLKGEPQITSTAYTKNMDTVDKMFFRGWTTEKIGQNVDYIAVYVADENNNDVIDTTEMLNLTKTGEGQVVFNDVTIVSGDAAVTGQDFLYDSQEMSYIYFAADNGHYISSLTIDGEVQTLGPSTRFYTKELGRGTKNITVEVTFKQSSKFALKEKPYTLKAKSSYTVEDVYNAVVENPTYVEENASCYQVNYIAREAGSYNVNVTAVWEYLDNHEVIGAYSSQIEPYFKQICSGNSTVGYTYSYTYDNAASLPLNAPVKEKTNAEITDGIIAGIEDKLGDLAAAAMSEDEERVKNIIKDIFEGQMRGANMHKFGNFVKNGELKDYETVSITYNDGAQILSTGNVQISLDRSTQTKTTISAKPVTVTYGQYTDADLLAKAGAKVLDADGNVVSGAEVKLATSYAGKSAGTYTVELVYAGDEEKEILGSTGSFALTVKTVEVSMTLPERNIVYIGDTVDFLPTVTVGGTEADNFNYIQLVAGVDLTGVNIDLNRGGATGELKIRAWLRVPEIFKSVVDEIFTAPSYKLTELEAKINALGEQIGRDDMMGSLSGAFDMIDAINTAADKYGVTLNQNVEISTALSDTPDAVGAYINYAVLVDTNCTNNGATAQGMLLIAPQKTLPNNGLQLVDSKGNASNFFNFPEGTDSTLKVMKGSTEQTDLKKEILYYGVNTNFIADESVIFYGTTPPTAPGLYIATIAQIVDGTVATDMALVLLSKKDPGKIQITDVMATEDGETFFRPEIKVPGDVAATILSGEVNATGVDNGLSDVKAQLNIDFPAGLDKLVKNKGYSYPKTATLEEAIAKTNEVLNLAKNELNAVRDMIPAISTEADTFVNNMVKGVEEQLNGVIAELEDIQKKNAASNIVVTFENNKGYKDNGVYAYAVIATDPDYNPTANMGWLIVEDSEIFEMIHTVHGYDGLGKDIDIANDTTRGYITIISDHSGNSTNIRVDKNLNKVTDHEMYEAVQDYFRKVAGVTLPNAVPKSVTVGQMKAYAEKSGDKLIDIVMGKLKSWADTDYNNKYVLRAESLAKDALAFLEGKLNATQTALQKELDALLLEDDDHVVYLNAALPSEVGEYTFRGIGYSVAFTEAKMEILPTAIITAEGKMMDQGGTIELTYTVDIKPEGTTGYDESKIKLAVLDAEGNEVKDLTTLAPGAYTIQVIAPEQEGFVTIINSNGSNALIVGQVDATLKATVNEAETANVLKGTDAKAVEELIHVALYPEGQDTEFTHPDVVVTYKILDDKGAEVKDLATALASAGTYTIEPVLKTNQFTVTDKASAKLVVVDSVTATATIDGKEEISVEVGTTELTEDKIAVVLDPEVVPALLGEKKYTITDAAGKVVEDLATALATAGTYTITPNVSADIAGIEIKAATLKIGKVEIANMMLSLELEGEVHNNFAFNVVGLDSLIETVDPETGRVDDIGLLVYNSRKENSSIENADDIISGGVYDPETNRYMVRSEGIPAKNMGDDTWYIVYIKVGNSYIYSSRYKFSPKLYAQSVVASDEYGEDLKALCVALMNYGSSAQEYFAKTQNYEYDTPMNSTFGAYQHMVNDFDNSMITDRIGWNASDFPIVADPIFTNVEYALTLEGAITYNLAFQTSKSSIDKAGILIWTDDQYLAGMTSIEDAMVVYASSENIDGSKYYAGYANIAAKEIGDTFFIAGFVEDEGVMKYSPVVRRSVDHFANSVITSNVSAEYKSLAKYLVVYGDYAYSYFKNK